MLSEFAKAKAHLAELKTKKRELDLRVSTHIRNSRDLIDPYEDDVTKLDTDSISLTVNDLISTIEELKAVNLKIEKIERDLK